MSKYIRTKDGISRLLRYGSKRKHYIEVYVEQIKGRKVYDTNEILKQADTIEELCDGYLCFTKSSKNWIITENYETAKLYAERGCKVNGCILTDKGLIFVAKMNEKGELELL